MKSKRYILWAIVGLLMLMGIAAGLFYGGWLQFNNPSRSHYPIRGVDVSSYQGEIDWDVLSAQGIDFAYLKATEGSSTQDATFAANYRGAMRTGLRVGAYHFFSFDSPGDTQAANFLQVVPVNDANLPPVVDVEFYGDKAAHPPDKALVQRELASLLEALIRRYRQQPVLYATEETYRAYLAGDFDRYDLWIRSVFTPPALPDKHWTFWQYSNRKRLRGYNGKERYIDMNVFSGSAEDFRKYGR